MGLFFADDSSYDESVRLTGFDRYRQLLSFNAGIYFKVNFLTIAGALPLAAGITYSVLATSILLLIPFSVIGGMIFGPFYAAFYDTLYRTFRDAPGRWFENWKKSFRRNLRDSLLPGAFLGMGTGLFVFTGFLFYWSEKAPGTPALIWLIVSAWLFMIILMLFWPQLVLFSQPLSATVRNMILFASKYLWKVLLAGALHIIVIAVYVLFAPWTIILVPLLGFWYITFLTQLILYEDLNRELLIEEKFMELESPSSSLPDETRPEDM